MLFSFVAVLALASVWCLLVKAYPSEYAPAGEWTSAKNPALECNRQYLCTPSNLTWYTFDPKSVIFDSKSACEGLIKAGIRRIDFHGDSYMRQIYAAMLITLNGNYVNGSIADTPFARANGAKECNYHKQFAEKFCGVRSLNHSPNVCDGKVILDPLLVGLDNLNQCSAKSGSVALFSWGNYKVGPQITPRHGVNNATAYAQFFEDSGLCPSIRKYDSHMQSSALGERAVGRSCNVVWLSTHYRLRKHYDDEGPDVVQTYNENMRSFIQSGKCGRIHYIDVYNMTAALGRGHAEEARGMSYDHVHWGMEVNLVKAQIILNALLQAPLSRK